MKKKIKDKNHKSSPNLKSSSSSFSCSAPSCFQFGSLLFSLHLVAPDEFLMFHNHLGQTFCFQKSPVPVAPPRNQSHISFFLSKTQKILNEIYGQIWHCYHSSSTDSKDVGTMTIFFVFHQISVELTRVRANGIQDDTFSDLLTVIIIIVTATNTYKHNTYAYLICIILILHNQTDF